MLGALLQILEHHLGSLAHYAKEQVGNGRLPNADGRESRTKRLAELSTQVSPEQHMRGWRQSLQLCAMCWSSGCRVI